VITQQRRAGEADFDGLRVRLVEVGEEAALGIVAAVDFVEEIDALETEIVIGGADDVGIVLELLDVDDGDFRPARIVVDGFGGLDITAKASRELMGWTTRPRLRNSRVAWMRRSIRSTMK